MGEIPVIEQYKKVLHEHLDARERGDEETEESTLLQLDILWYRHMTKEDMDAANAYSRELLEAKPRAQEEE